MLTFRNAFWCKLPLMYSGDFRPNRHRWISRLFCSYSHHSPRIVLLFRRINASQLKNDTKNINHSFILIPYIIQENTNSNGLKLFMKEGRDFLHTPKGQLISKCPFGVIVWTKKPTIFFQDLCPSL